MLEGEDGGGERIYNVAILLSDHFARKRDACQSTFVIRDRRMRDGCRCRDTLL